MLAKSEDRNHFSKNKSTPVVMAAMTVDATAKARKVRRRASQPSDSHFICGHTTMQMLCIHTLLFSSSLTSHPPLYWTLRPNGGWMNAAISWNYYMCFHGSSIAFENLVFGVVGLYLLLLQCFCYCIEEEQNSCCIEMTLNKMGFADSASANAIAITAATDTSAIAL